ncbi:hypothetical protein GCM10010404_61720 [Nonomuraea africana]|uniref:Transposase InsH N-terminal domain-containing protein n=1 Tax=Nonomuraea africana TaxID=46171 RepID=A0ABR9K7P2_9ACTN|nr:hypothetical protein [Nonomuraea africana]
MGSHFDAVQQLRCDLRWKAACGLGLYDTAFDPSLLTYFRRRLARSADPDRIFTRIKEVVAATGVLGGPAAAGAGFGRAGGRGPPRRPSPS